MRWSSKRSMLHQKIVWRCIFRGWYWGTWGAARTRRSSSKRRLASLRLARDWGTWGIKFIPFSLSPPLPISSSPYFYKSSLSYAMLFIFSLHDRQTYSAWQKELFPQRYALGGNENEHKEKRIKHRQELLLLPLP